MARLRTDAPLSRCIVSAFLDFLHSVEPAPGVDLEGLEVAKDCLTEVFRLDQLSGSERPEPNILFNIFRSQETNTQTESQAGQSCERSTLPSEHNSAAEDPSTASISLDDDSITEAYNPGVYKDELFGTFFDALEKIGFFRRMPNGDDDHDLLDRATRFFHDAVHEMEKSGLKECDRNGLAEALKTLGNKAMQSKLYSDAIDCYTCAIALSDSNAVYYCNRAAAYTQICKYDEAIRDCMKSIEIDPNYSKAYSRLGFAYYAQGNYNAAINQGFRKVLQLDPNNEAVQENIKAAEQKLREEQQRRGYYQESSNQFAGGSRNQTAPPPSASVSFDTSSFLPNFATMFGNVAENANPGMSTHSGPAEDNHGMPPPFASMFMNMSPNASFPGQSSPNWSAEPNHGTGTSHPVTSMSFDVNALPADVASLFANMAGQGRGSQGQPPGDINFGGQTPEEVSRTLRSVMGMFSGAPQGDQRGNDNGRSAPS